jgi:hypothetical protein
MARTQELEQSSFAKENFMERMAYLNCGTILCVGTYGDIGFSSDDESFDLYYRTPNNNGCPFDKLWKVDYDGVRPAPKLEITELV